MNPFKLMLYIWMIVMLGNSLRYVYNENMDSGIYFLIIAVLCAVLGGQLE